MITRESSICISCEPGTLRIAAVEHGITRIEFVEDCVVDIGTSEDLTTCIEQLREYFAGARRTFDSFPLVLRATDFQQRVWDAAAGIPFGQTVTYGELAKEIGSPDAARAVGTALSRNVLGIIIPCHRVVPASGAADLGGFAWGVERKKWLIEHERRIAAGAST